MLFYNLGTPTWAEAQAITCALAQLKRDAAVLAHLDSPGICVGGQVNVGRQVDMSYCRTRGIPVFQRPVHGHMLCAGASQIELQLVLARNHRLLLQSGSGRFRAALLPLLNTMRDFAVDASYRPPNELVVHGRRIVSACLGEVDHCTVIAAHLALDFDPALLAQALYLPSEDPSRMEELLSAHRTSLREELGTLPSVGQFERRLRSHLQSVVGGLRPGEIDAELQEQMQTSAALAFASPLGCGGDTLRNGWNLDLGAGGELIQCTYQAPGGFLRATCEWQDGRIARALLSGDFFCYPPGGLFRLEKELIGLTAEEVAMKMGGLYRKLGLVTPGIQSAQWVRVLTPASKQSVKKVCASMLKEE
ncbi:MAG: hypothetical protein M1570_06640 [Chloroflexi bacterium]|nr:hypothetical protein [Chloroflexota bacterium]